MARIVGCVSRTIVILVTYRKISWFFTRIFSDKALIPIIGVSPIGHMVRETHPTTYLWHLQWVAGFIPRWKGITLQNIVMTPGPVPSPCFFPDIPFPDQK